MTRLLLCESEAIDVRKSDRSGSNYLSSTNDENGEQSGIKEA